MPATGRQAALTDSEGWTLSLGSGARMAVFIDALVRLPGTVRLFSGHDFLWGWSFTFLKKCSFS